MFLEERFKVLEDFSSYSGEVSVSKGKISSLRWTPVISDPSRLEQNLATFTTVPVRVETRILRTIQTDISIKSRNQTDQTMMGWGYIGELTKDQFHVFGSSFITEKNISILEQHITSFIGTYLHFLPRLFTTTVTLPLVV